MKSLVDVLAKGKGMKMTAEFMQKNEHLAEPLFKIYEKKFRKMALDLPLLEKKKLVLPAKRFRGVEDTLELMKQRKEVGGVINKRDELPDVDFVLDTRQLVKIKQKKSLAQNSYYVQLPDREEIRVTCENLQKYPGENWFMWAKFNRYIVGRPNLLWMPIKYEYNFENKFFNKGSELRMMREGVWVYSYNEDYPLFLSIDPAYCSPNRPYKLGDLSNLLPDGMVLHPQYNRILNQRVLRIGPEDDRELKKELEREAAENINEDDIKLDETDEFEEFTLKKKTTDKKKPQKKRKERNLKKMIAQMGVKVKAEFQAKEEEEAKDPAANKKKAS